MSETPRTDSEEKGASYCTGVEIRQAWNLARQLERENAELSDQLMRWFKAASPYATPGSLEEGLKKLREELIEECALICESRAGEGQYAESQAAWRILISAAHAIRALKNFQPDGPIDSTVKPSAWD